MTCTYLQISTSAVHWAGLMKFGTRLCGGSRQTQSQHQAGESELHDREADINLLTLVDIRSLP